jgi:putative ABC transport system permease protein
LINKLVWENLKHRPVRTSLSAIAIGVQVTMILTLVGISRGMIEDSATRTRSVGADILVRPPGSSIINLTGAPMKSGHVKLIREQPHVAAATGVLVHNYSGINNLYGIDLAEFMRLNGGFTYLSGGPFRNPEDLIVDDYFARQRNLRVGDTIELVNHKWRVCGIVASGKLARACVQLSVLQDLTSNAGKLTMVYVKVDRPENIDTAVKELKAVLNADLVANGGDANTGYQVLPVEEFLSQFTVDNIPALKQFIWVVVGLSVVFGFLVVFLSMYTAVLERTREIGILKALGASSALVARILLRETALLAIIGSILGIIFTFGTRFVIMSLFPATLVQKIVPDWWPITTAIALGGAILGTVYPGLKAAKQDTVEALTYE